MGVYFKGVEMPRNCYVCPFCDYVSARCDAVKGNPYTPESRYEKRADFCPLVPVPPHGDLIDYDFCMENYELLHDDDGNPVYAVRMRDINIAPTIIPADHEEEEMK